MFDLQSIMGKFNPQQATPAPTPYGATAVAPGAVKQPYPVIGRTPPAPAAPAPGVGGDPAANAWNMTKDPAQGATPQGEAQQIPSEYLTTYFNPWGSTKGAAPQP